MRSSLTWWNAIKGDGEAFVDWLRKQYHGEITAHDRIRSFLATHVPADSPWRRTLELIASQELTHASWVGELLRARGIEPAVLDKDERYWDATLPGATDFASAAAVAAHAEQMRLERITVIAADEDAPADVRGVFARILPEERFHATAFRRMAGEPAFAATLARHELGMEAIGLIPAGF